MEITTLNIHFYLENKQYIKKLMWYYPKGDTRRPKHSRKVTLLNKLGLRLNVELNRLEEQLQGFPKTIITLMQERYRLEIIEEKLNQNELTDCPSFKQFILDVMDFNRNCSYYEKDRDKYRIDSTKYTINDSKYYRNFEKLFVYYEYR